MRSTLGHALPGHALHRMSDEQVQYAFRKAIEDGTLVFMPNPGELRACLKAIQEDRQNARQSAAPHLQQPTIADQASLLYGNPPRVPEDPGASPVDDLPDALGNGVQQDAGIPLTPEEEAECEGGLTSDLDRCSALAAADKSLWWPCHGQAMNRYGNCLTRRIIL